MSALTGAGLEPSTVMSESCESLALTARPSDMPKSNLAKLENLENLEILENLENLENLEYAYILTYRL